MPRAVHGSGLFGEQALHVLESLFTTTAFFAQILVPTQVDKAKANGEGRKAKGLGGIILSGSLALSPHCSLLSPCSFAALGCFAGADALIGPLFVFYESAKC